MSEETQRHVIVARGTRGKFHAHPTTVILPDNETMYCVWRRDHSGPCGPMAMSRDAGLTWMLKEMSEEWGHTNSPPCIYLLEATGGKKRLMVFSVRRKRSKPPGPMTVSCSEDGGATWSEMRDAKQEAGEKLMCHSPFTAIQVVDGGHLGMYQRCENDNGCKPMQVWKAFSADGGLTWKDVKCVYECGRLHPSEPELVMSPDRNNMLCLMRAWERNAADRNVRRHLSLWMLLNDSGIKLSHAKETSPGLIGHRHRARYAPEPDGRLVVVLRDKDAGSPYREHFVAWVGTYKDITEGRPGQYRVKLLHTHKDLNAAESWYERDCGYAGLELLPDGTFLATTYVKYRGGPEGNSIVSVRFRLSEFDKKAKEQQKRR